MNRKRMRKRSISWLLVLSMVLSLFGGEFASPLSAKAYNFLYISKKML